MTKQVGVATGAFAVILVQTFRHPILRACGAGSPANQPLLNIGFASAVGRNNGSGERGSTAPSDMTVF